MKRIFILLLLINMYLQSSQTAYESALQNVIGSFSSCTNCNHMQWDMAQELFPRATEPIFALDPLHNINHLLEKNNFKFENINEIQQANKGIAILKHFSKGNPKETILSIKDDVIETQQQALVEQARTIKKLETQITLQNKIIDHDNLLTPQQKKGLQTIYNILYTCEKKDSANTQ